MKIFPLKADYGDALVIEAQGIKKMYGSLLMVDQKPHQI